MNTRIKKKLPVLLPALLIFFTWGCSHPDHWAVADRQLERYGALAPVKPVLVPDEWQPRAKNEHRFEMPAGNTLELSVEQAILFSLQNNQDLHVRQLTPVIAGTFEKIERGVFDPELFADLEYTSEEISDISRADGNDSYEIEGHAAVAGLRQQLPYGTMVEASIAQNRGGSNRSDQDQKARLGLSITQSLLRGLGPAVNLVQVRQAELNTAATIYELRGVTEALLADTENAYWNYVLARQKIDIFERSLAIALQQLDEIRQRIEVGILPQIEEAAAHAETARREQALIDARSNLQETRLRLLKLINPRESRQLDIQLNATSEPLINAEPVTDLDDRLQLARRARPDLNEARLRLHQDRLEIIMTRNGLLPRLDLFISLGKTGYGESFADSFRNLGENSYDFTAGIQLSRFLGNRQAAARYLAARATWQQSSESVKNLEQIVELDVRLAVNEVERSRQQITATRATRLLQEETLQAEKERFDVGSSTALLVAQAQRDLLASSIDEVEAVVNYRQALVALYLVEGSLLERRGVRLAGSP
jgi:outer membrane protein